MLKLGNDTFRHKFCLFVLLRDKAKQSVQDVDLAPPELIVSRLTGCRADDRHTRSSQEELPIVCW